MQQWPEHSLYGYLTRLSTDKLELILDARYDPAPSTSLLPEDYDFIEQLLYRRPDSRLFGGGHHDRK